MQSKLFSFIETVTNILVGYWLAVGTQMLVFPLFGWQCTFKENCTVGLIFTVVSLVRGYTIRRIFNQFRR